VRAETFDVVIIGAGAAGMMCAVEAGRRGRRVLVVDHAAKAGEKIRISGGGRCNFTNLDARPHAFLSANPHFCRSALARYTAKDFIALVDRHGIAWHEKTLGQLFCDGSATQIIDMLRLMMAEAGVVLRLSTTVGEIERTAGGFAIALSSGPVTAASLVVACGGKSIPKMGATGLGYDIARQFGLNVTDTRPALVPLTFDAHLLERLGGLAGVAVETATATAGGKTFREAVLFTHRGISGPAILQASSYWREGDEIVLDMAPGADVLQSLKAAKAANGKQAAHTALGSILPNRLAKLISDNNGATGNLADAPEKMLRSISAAVSAWRVKPVGSEGYRTAEVTLGGVDTRGLDQKTMEARNAPGLYFIGECVDVTGWLGGYNFQWAWSSGWAAGQAA